MKKWFVCLVPVLLSADWEQLFDDQDSTLFHQINVISGHLNFVEKDLVIAGAYPLPISRSYCSAESINLTFPSNDNPMRFLPTQGGWNVFAHHYLLFSRSWELHNSALAWDSNGALLQYQVDLKQLHGWKNFPIQSECTNRMSGSSAQQNHSLIRLDFLAEKGMFHMHLPDGTLRVYSGSTVHKHTDSRHSLYTLEEEHLPSGHVIYYDYDSKKRLTQIELKSPKGTLLSNASLTQSSKHKAYRFSMETSDRQHVEYKGLRQNKVGYIDTVSVRGFPEQRYGYTRLVDGKKAHGISCSSMRLKGDPSFLVKYCEGHSKHGSKQLLYHWNGRATSIAVPSGPNDELIPLAEYDYHPTSTFVTEPSGKKTLYHYNQGGLDKIEYFDANKVLASTLRYFWKNRFIKTKVHCDSKGAPLVGVAYEVDAKGNVTQETLFGNLSGKASSLTLSSDGTLEGGEQYSKTYKYDDNFNIRLEESDSLGQKILYQFLPKTNLCTAIFKKYENQILERTFHFYDEDHLLIKTIQDDGSSENPYDYLNVHLRQLIQHTRNRDDRMISETAVYYEDPCNQTLHLREKTLFQYDASKNIIQEDHYDRENRYRYNLKFQYDEGRRLLAYTNALGEWSHIEYNELGHVVYEHEALNNPKVFTRDRLGRVKEIKTLGKNEDYLEKTEYGPTRDPMVKINRLGHRTTQEFDLMGKASKSIFPSLLDEQGHRFDPIITFEYDSLDNLISSSDGHVTTRTRYNAYKKPIWHSNAMGFETTTVYDLKGQVIQQIDPEGINVYYRYNPLGKLVEKKTTFNDHLVCEELFEYEGSLLSKHTSETGLVTTFCYNVFGEKIEESTQGRTTRFSYDSLGHVYKTSTPIEDAYTEYDLLGRVIKRYQLSAGQELNNTQYAYDALGNLIKVFKTTQEGIAIDEFAYDSLGRMVSHRDPKGYLSTTEYIPIVNALGQTVEDKITCDPLGVKTKTHFDVNGKPLVIQIFDPQGTCVSEQQLYYNRLGQKVKLITLSFKDGLFEKDHTLEYRYDFLGNLLETLEQKERRTRFSYDQRSRLIEKTLPSGLQLYYVYDPLDRLVCIKSSDGSVHDTFEYGLFSEAIKATNHIDGVSVERTLDDVGTVIAESRNGLLSTYTYDSLGRLVQLDLPSTAPISYRYEGKFLTHVTYKNYTHTYEAFNSSGQSTKKTLMGSWGSQEVIYDILDRPIHKQNAHHRLLQSYDAKGRVKQVRCSLSGIYDYTYDPLSQLIQENETLTSFDALKNPRVAVVSPFNELLEYQGITCCYDEAGNLKSKAKTAFTYDALGRLKILSTPETTIKFIYDPFSRLHSYEENGETFYLLYASEVEVGRIDAQKNLLELKIIGEPIGNGLLEPLCYQIKDKLYLPLLDFRGSCLGLIDEHNRLVESTSYNGFGQASQLLVISPWGFLQTRSMHALNLMGHRIYDPALKRFITPDPLGYAECLNLYVYALNSPLNRHDLSGLYSVGSHANPTQPSMNWMTGVSYNPKKGDLSLSGQYHLFQGTPALYTSVTDIESNPHLLTARMQNGQASTNWAVSLPPKTQLNFSEREKASGQVNLFDHFDSLLPKKNNCIGTYIYTNGINTSFTDMKNIVASARDKIPENVPIFGAYNPSYGLINDLARFRAERNNIATPAAIKHSVSLGHIAELTHKINPTLITCIVAHSEGALAVEVGRRLMTPHQQEVLKSNFTFLGLGAARPLSNDHFKKADNYYSQGDLVTKFFGWYYSRKDQNINVHYVDCKSSLKNQTAYLTDHGIFGETYDSVQRVHFDFQREQDGIGSE